ncbi:MAG: CPBP family intramembrane metalloprotease [Candidatus Eisenbacteria bacterium]|nr:CPBP family intramembrane metalloprotease [Candidatus Eisenbacteria bacterium]
MDAARLDLKGISSFLSITFVATYAIELALILGGFRITRLPAGYGQLVIAAVMWVPALAAVLTIRLVTREGFAIANCRFGSWKPYLASGVLVPLCFVLIYGLTWLLGLGRPDWEMRLFRDILRSSGGAGLSHVPSPAIVLPALFLVTLVTAPFLNGLLGLGEELGWRGYLLPKLMVLGKPRAYLLLGIVWGLWHLPLILIGFTYPGHPVLGTLAFLLLTTTFGIYLNELSLRHRSSILAGWIHGVFNSQKLGVWVVLFPSVNPLLGGFAGLVGIGVWLALGVWEMRRHE